MSLAFAVPKGPNINKKINIGSSDDLVPKDGKRMS